MRMPLLRSIVALFLLLAFLCPAHAVAADRREVVVYFFWGDGCPHCAREKVYLDSLTRKHPEIRLMSYEVWKNRANASFFTRMTEDAGIASTGVPVTFVGTGVFVGFSDRTAREIDAAIGRCLAEGCIDPSKRPAKASGLETVDVDIPLFGRLDASKVSLPLLTLVLGVLDSFNPCAFFVLFFLLSLMIHARSRGKMLLIGTTFVLFSGLIYFVFMAAWLNLFILTGQLALITAAAGVVALGVAVINIKDFFFFRKGVSLSIPEQAKPKLFERMRNLLKSSSVPSILAGTAVLAVAANAYELLCTAGFPMVFTRALTLQKLPMTSYYLYLVLYNVIYVTPLFLIVVFFTATLGARKLTEWQGRKLKLISGLMMFMLGLALLVRPALLNNALAAAGLLTVSLALWGIIIAATKKQAA
ncbi:MAG: membrane protein [Thermodesulfovibrionales bacterium]